MTEKLSKQEKQRRKALLSDALLSAPPNTFVKIIKMPNKGKFTLNKEYQVFQWDLVTHQSLDLLLIDDDNNEVWVYTAYTSPPETRKK